MASLSNINGLFDVHSTGAILFSTSHGTSGQILRSNGNAAPTWVAASTVVGGPYLPIAGGVLEGATSTDTGINFTVGGNLFGTSATFSGNVTVGNSGNINIPTAASGNANLHFDGTDFKITSNSSSANLKLETSSTTRLTINSAGNSTFAGNLTVNSRGFFNSGAAYPLVTSSTQRYNIQIRNTNNTVNSGYGWWWGTDTNFNMFFHADGASDRMTLTRLGELGVNWASPGGYGQLTVGGTSALPILALRSASGKVRQGFYEGGTGRFYFDTLGADGLAFIDGDGLSERMRITDYGSLVVGNTPGTNVNWGKIQCGGTITVGNSSGTYNTHGRISGDSDGMKLKGTSTGTYSDPQGVTINGYNVGINTNSPNVGNAFGLVIRSWATLSRLVFWNNTSGEVSSRGQRISFSNANCIFENMESGYYAFKTGGSGANPSERMRIFSNGNVNIGVAEAGASAVTGPFVVTHTSSRFLTSSYEESSVSLSAKNNNNNLETLRLAGDSIKFFNGTNAVGSQKMVILNNGNVGIGTTGPLSKLELGPNGSLGANTVNKKVTLNVDGGYTTTGVGSTGQYKVIGFVGTTRDVTDITGQTSGEVQKNFYLGTIGFDYFNGNRFSFWQGGAERLTIQGYGASAGNVGIGTTSPNAPLDVLSLTSGSSGIQQWSYNTAPSSYRLQLNQIVSSGLVKYSFDQLNAGAGYNNVIVLDRGNVGIGTASPTQPLDVNGYSICDKQFQRDNSTTIILGTPRILNIGYQGSSGTYDFNPVTLFGNNAQGGQCEIQVTGWQNKVNNGFIYWRDNGSNTNIGNGIVGFVQTAVVGSGVISVSTNAGGNVITITFTGWHSNAHGWNAKIISNNS